MNIEIITIGDELLIGQVIDTNSAWISKKMSGAGFDVVYITSIKDSKEAIYTAIEDGFNRADIILITGGNGPTKDDITKHTLSEYFNDELVFDEKVLENIETIFEEKNIPLNDLTRNQAYVPQESTVIQNKMGTAPILWFEKNEKILISMPGVPFEMRWAMNEEILPRLVKRFQTETFLKHVFYTQGISESALAILLDNFEMQLPHDFKLAYLPSGGVIRLRLSTKGDQHLSEMKKQAVKLKNILGSYLLVESDENLQQVLANMLKEKQMTISLAESCSGGYLARLLTNYAGASNFFVGGVVSYANSAKMNLLGVKSSTLEQFGAVSKQVVNEMALGAIDKFGTDCAIAISGVAGPDGGSGDKPVGTVYISTICKNKIVCKHYLFGKSRENNIRRSAIMAMVQMIRCIQ